MIKTNCEKEVTIQQKNDVSVSGWGVATRILLLKVLARPVGIDYLVLVRLESLAAVHVSGVSAGVNFQR